MRGKNNDLKFMAFIIFIMIAVLIGFSYKVHAKTEGYTLEWDANTEPDLAGYKVYMGTASGEYSLIETINERLALPKYEGEVIENADKLTTFYFAVTAFDADGLESGFSNEVSQEVDARVPPAPPKNLKWYERIIAWIQKHLFGQNLRIT